MWTWLKRITLAGIAITISWFLLGMPSSPEQKRTKTAPVLRIATANVNVANPHPQWLGKRMGTFDADIILIVEPTDKNIDLVTLENTRTDASLQRHNRRQKAKDETRTPDPKPPVPYEYFNLKYGANGIAFLTRQSLNANAELVISPTRGNCHWPIATLRFNWQGTWYSALGIHAPPPVDGCSGNEDYLMGIAPWIHDGKMTFDIGVAQRGDPVILLGDLNTMPMTRNIKLLLDLGLQDGYDEASFRPGPTWGFKYTPDFARIDYVLPPKSVVAWNAWTLDLPGSDHRAVMVDIMQAADAPK